MKLDNYLIGKTLGTGSYGKVKLGICWSINKKVAIKIFDKNFIE